MILSDAIHNPFASQLYMERYVNRGSPSGFSSLNTTSSETSHLGEAPSFWLHAVRPAQHYEILEFGEPQFVEPGLILIHPDLVDDCPLRECAQFFENFLEVAPTASDRTVQAIAEPNLYFKLSYPPMIGRMSRRLGAAQAEAAVWVTNAIERSRAHVDPAFKFLREGYARVAVTDTPRPQEWGFTVRDKHPSPLDPATTLMVPGFSLFSTDRKALDDEVLLVQLFENQSKPASDFLFDDIIRPLIDGYFSLLVHAGLQLEAHAQNILFGVDSRGQVTCVVARDAESVDRDVSLMDDLAIEGERPSGTYKIIRRADYNYHIMHSFMFDFKMGEYLIRPILECARERLEVAVPALAARIRDHARSWIARLPADFFPDDGCWYSYDNIVHPRGKRRAYTATPGPKFR